MVKLSTTILLACVAYHANAHIAMTQPAWNSGTAETSECAEVIKNTFGFPGLSSTSFSLFANTANDGTTCMHVDAGSTTPQSGTFTSDGQNTISNVTVITGTKTAAPGTFCYKHGGNYAKLMECQWKLNRDAFWFNTGTMIGCPAVTGQSCSADTPCCSTDELMEPTNTDPAFSSFAKANGAIGSKADKYRYNPWRAPGHAPVLDPCGIVGGFTWDKQVPALYINGPESPGSLVPKKKGRVVNGAAAPTGMEFSAGTKGSPLFHSYLSAKALKPSNYTTPVTRWTAGESAEVAMGAWYANHGGGSQYRLCKASEFTADGIKNEECFQRTPLGYATDSSWVQFGNDKKHRTEFKAVRVSDENTKGVKPSGSTWTKVPVPNCKDLACFKERFGGHTSNTTKTNNRLEFDEPAGGAFGFGMASYGVNYQQRVGPSITSATFEREKKHYDFQIVDKVLVPKDLEGTYVLSWRWDSEQTAQVWSNCAIVEIEANAESKSNGAAAVSNGDVAVKKGTKEVVRALRGLSASSTDDGS